MGKLNRSLESLAYMFRLVGDQTRLRILVTLRDGELNVTEICKKLKLPQPTVSRHLGILRMGGLVSNRRSGKEIYYSLNEYQADRYGKVLKDKLNRSASIRIGPMIFGLSKR
ncbi:MAG: ArsR/SmtB family transcription factor [Alphaproteobacteria bacterium]